MNEIKRFSCHFLFTSLSPSLFLLLSSFTDFNSLPYLLLICRLHHSTGHGSIWRRKRQMNGVISVTHSYIQIGNCHIHTLSILNTFEHTDSSAHISKHTIRLFSKLVLYSIFDSYIVCCVLFKNITNNSSTIFHYQLSERQCVRNIQKKRRKKNTEQKISIGQSAGLFHIHKQIIQFTLRLKRVSVHVQLSVYMWKSKREREREIERGREQESWFAKFIWKRYENSNRLLLVE